MKKLLADIERLQNILTIETIEHSPFFEMFVNEACHKMQEFLELTGYSWADYMEVNS